MSGRNSMDIDQEPVNGASPQTPKKQTNFSVPIPNGSSHDGAPAPPPHRSNPSSPIPTPEEDAESYKAAGNRFFKEKNYSKAIEQYSKGAVILLWIIREKTCVLTFPLQPSTCSPTHQYT